MYIVINTFYIIILPMDILETEEDNLLNQS